MSWPLLSGKLLYGILGGGHPGRRPGRPSPGPATYRVCILKDPPHTRFEPGPFNASEQGLTAMESLRNVTSLAGDAGLLFQSFDHRAEAVIIHPPRHGLTLERDQVLAGDAELRSSRNTGLKRLSSPSRTATEPPCP